MAIRPDDEDFGKKMIRFLGLPERTIGFELRCYVNEAVTVKCEWYPEPNSEEPMAGQFRLERIEDAE